MAELSWTDAQWQKVNDAVTEAFGKASIASAFLPCYGPLSGSAEIVRNERLIQVDARKSDVTGDPIPPMVKLDGDHRGVNLRLVNLTVNVILSSEQVADETLSNAMLAFGRAANLLAQEEDRIVFAGFGRGPGGDDSKYVANARLEPQKGLADLVARQDFPSLQPAATQGQSIINAVVNAIHGLEDDFNPGPFACVLGNTLYEAVYAPTQNLVLPADTIKPMLKGGPLLRAGKMDVNSGIVVSLAGNAVDIVVGTPPTVQFLQRTQDAKFLFRVYERFVLRIRDAKRKPVRGFRVPPSTRERAAEELLLDIIATQG